MDVENPPKSDVGHRWALPISAKVRDAGVGDVRVVPWTQALRTLGI
jgi:hypothetical protein